MDGVILLGGATVYVPEFDVDEEWDLYPHVIL